MGLPAGGGVHRVAATGGRLPAPSRRAGNQQQRQRQGTLTRWRGTPSVPLRAFPPPNDGSGARSVARVVPVRVAAAMMAALVAAAVVAGAAVGAALIGLLLSGVMLAVAVARGGLRPVG